MTNDRIFAFSRGIDSNKSKLLENCTLPLTGKNCVKKIVTNLAVMEIENSKFILKEYAPGVSIEEIIDKTDGETTVAPDICEMKIN